VAAEADIKTAAANGRGQNIWEPRTLYLITDNYSHLHLHLQHYFLFFQLAVAFFPIHWTALRKIDTAMGFWGNS
jgi:hypothetical protein